MSRKEDEAIEWAAQYISGLLEKAGITDPDYAGVASSSDVLVEAFEAGWNRREALFLAENALYGEKNGREN